MGPIAPFGAILPCNERSTSLYDISYHVDSKFHNITRISKTSTISLRFGVQIQYSEITNFFVWKLLACFVYSTCVHGNYRICALYTDANSLSLVFDVVRLLRSSIWVIESDCVRYRLCENKVGNLLGV